MILSSEFNVYIQGLRLISSKFAFENAPIYEVEGLAASLTEALKTRDEYILNSLGIDGLNEERQERNNKPKSYQIYMDN